MALPFGDSTNEMWSEGLCSEWLHPALHCRGGSEMRSNRLCRRNLRELRKTNWISASIHPNSGVKVICRCIVRFSLFVEACIFSH